MVENLRGGVIVEGGCALNIVNYCILCSFNQVVITMKSPGDEERSVLGFTVCSLLNIRVLRFTV